MRPLAHHGTHEFAMLSQSFLDMAQRLHDRSDYIHTFAAHVSHELKSPLTSIRGAAELLRDSLGAAAHRMTDAERRAFLDNIVADAERLTALLNRLRELARADNPQVRGRSALAPVIAELRSAFPELTIRAVGALEREARISAENLRIALSHLADNAARHGAKTLAIQAEEERGFVRLTVRDDGEGISEQNRERIFDPFFTTRREKGGTGMGLVIVRSLFEAHGGSIALRASSGGAAFEIRLPA
jgi:two-component system, OmpR family, sensor histidine kinase CreC